jgi:hypothetical protein
MTFPDGGEAAPRHDSENLKTIIEKRTFKTVEVGRDHGQTPGGQLGQPCVRAVLMEAAPLMSSDSRSASDE